MPEAKANAALPSSRSATLRSKAKRVGLWPAVIEALVPAPRLLHVSADDVDRHHDGIGRWIECLARMNGPRAEGQSGRWLRRIWADHCHSRADILLGPKR